MSKALLDTNILIHREVPTPVKADIGILFRWLDKLQYTKCVHPASVKEVQKLKNETTKAAFNIKLDSYYILQSPAPIATEIRAVSKTVDENANDIIDSRLLNEVFCDRVELLLTEDKKIHRKAALLGISDRVFKINSFLEKVTSENPELTEYKVLSVKKGLFGSTNLSDPFFDSFKDEYKGFEKWFNQKSDEPAYTCSTETGITAFLYLKVEGQNEPYNDIEPVFPAKKRLKIGTFKVSFNGYKIGERFLKIIFDNAMSAKVDEIYVTIFEHSDEQQRLIALLESFGFIRWGQKVTSSGEELVLVRSMLKEINQKRPKQTFPFFGGNGRTFLVPIYPDWHTSLFPDSILNNESPENFAEHEPFRNAISKVYTCRSWRKDLEPGDTIVFYRTGGYYKGVVTTIGIVESVITQIPDETTFIRACRKRSVFSDQELSELWNKKRSHPMIVNFLYAYSFPRRPNMAELIDIGVIADRQSAPQGFQLISPDQFKSILAATKTNDHFIIN